jgi:hypothetical protein
MSPEIRRTYMMLCYRNPTIWKEIISPVDSAKDLLKIMLTMGKLIPEDYKCLKILNKYHIE